MTTRTPAPLPEGPRQVLPSNQFANPEKSIEYYEERIRREPGDVPSYAALAQANLQMAETTARETKYVPAAQRAIETGLSLAPDDYHLTLLKGTLLNKLHQFEQARDLARELIAENPRHAYPYGILIDALVELGAYDEAVEANDRMLAIKPGIPSYTRAAYLRELHGDTEGAIAAMRLAADAGLSGTPDRGWALYNLGVLYLSQAKLDTAAFIFEGLLEEQPGYARALGGLGHVSLLRGDLDEAERQLDMAYEAVPRDAFLELLAEVYALRGETAKERRTLARVHDGLKDARAMGEQVDMEEADFMLDQNEDVERALVMAKAQYERRPGHMHASETYAWALHKNGRSGEGIPYIENAMRLNTGDAMVHHRAAQIYRGAGQNDEAARQARLALDGNLRAESPTAAMDAQRMLVELGGSAQPVRQVSSDL